MIMPTLKSDRQETWILDRDRLTWILPEDVMILVGSDETGIEDNGTGNEIRVLGNILGEDAGYGITAGDNASVYVGADAWIAGFGTGIDGDDANILVLNHGLIQAEWGISATDGKVVNSGSIISQDETDTTAAVFFENRGEIENTGLISGGDGIRTYNGGSVLNKATGVIVGQGTGVNLGDLDGEVSVIENHGILRGREYAIDSSGETWLINRGAIFGDVELSHYADRIDTRGGSVKGAIRGGEGDDTYLVSSQDIRIDETGASFGDVVKSTASFVLRGGLDDLYLLGGIATAGYGNGGDNGLFGSKAINALYGLEGDDILAGRGGNDVLAGGTGSDQFWFQNGYDVDTIEDFENGVDIVILADAFFETPFGKWDIRQKGVDVVIDFGHGDRLLLQKFAVNDLDRGDFDAAA
jgi:Ca2+-binding RTX toxin-like protein